MQELAFYSLSLLIMRLTIAFVLVESLALASAALTDRYASPVSGALMPRASCDNTATSRDCWGDYSIDTDYYTDGPDTGVIREVMLSFSLNSDYTGPLTSNSTGWML